MIHVHINELCCYIVYLCCRNFHLFTCVRATQDFLQLSKLDCCPPSFSLSLRGHSIRTGYSVHLRASLDMMIFAYVHVEVVCLFYSILQLCIPALVHLEWPHDVKERHNLLPLTDQPVVRKLMLQFLLLYLLLPYGSLLFVCLHVFCCHCRCLHVHLNMYIHILVFFCNQVLRNQGWPAASSRAQSNTHCQCHWRGNAFT